MLHLSIYLSLPEIFISFYSFELLSINNQETAFSISCRTGVVVLNSLSFCLSKNVLISSFLKDILLYIKLLVNNLYFWFKYATLLPSSLHSFWRKFDFLSYWGSFILDKLFLSCNFKILSLSLVNHVLFISQYGSLWLFPT